MQYLLLLVWKLWFDRAFMFLDRVFRTYITYALLLSVEKNKCWGRIVVECSEEFIKWNSHSNVAEEDWEHTLNIKTIPEEKHVICIMQYDKANTSLGILMFGSRDFCVFSIFRLCVVIAIFSINLPSSCKNKALLLFYLFTFYLQHSCFARGVLNY